MCGRFWRFGVRRPGPRPLRAGPARSSTRSTTVGDAEPRADMPERRRLEHILPALVVVEEAFQLLPARRPPGRVAVRVGARHHPAVGDLLVVLAPARMALVELADLGGILDTEAGGALEEVLSV